MPTGSAGAPWGGEAGLTLFGSLPEGEVEGVLFTRALSIGDATAGVLLLFTQISATQLSVPGVFHHREIHISFGAVGSAFRFQFADEGTNSIQALGCPRHAVGSQDSEGIHVCMKCINVPLAHGCHR